jgi:hypothetical protein
MFCFASREDGLRQIRVRAHRFSFALSSEEDMTGREVCHRCDNPACVNPAHLSLGSHRDNHLDSVRKGRKRAWGIQKLNAAQVYIIRARAAAGDRHTDIAADFKVARNTVTGIVNRAFWKHLPPHVHHEAGRVYREIRDGINSIVLSESETKPCTGN